MNNFYKLILGVCSLATLGATMTSCGKEYSEDTPIPAAYQSSIFSTTQLGVVYALDPVTGEKRWEFQAETGIKASPIVMNNTLYVFDSLGGIYKINPVDGKEIGHKDLFAPVEGTPLVLENNLVIPSGNGVITLTPSNFDTVWVYDAGEPVRTSPATQKLTLDNELKTVVFVAGKNKIHAIRMENGVGVYAEAVGTGTFESSICATSNGFLYVGNSDRNIYALKSSDADVVWSYATNSEVKSSPISVGGNIIVGGGDNKLYSVDSATGNLRWLVTTNDKINSSPAFLNQKVYFGSNDYNIYCVDVIDGTIKWKQLTSGIVGASPVVYNNTVYVNSYDKNMYALDALTGLQKWIYNTNGIGAVSPVIDLTNGSVMSSISGNYQY